MWLDRPERRNAFDAELIEARARGVHVVRGGRGAARGRAGGARRLVLRRRRPRVDARLGRAHARAQRRRRRAGRGHVRGRRQLPGARDRARARRRARRRHRARLLLRHRARARGRALRLHRGAARADPGDDRPVRACAHRPLAGARALPHGRAVRRRRTRCAIGIVHEVHADDKALDAAVERTLAAVLRGGPRGRARRQGPDRRVCATATRRRSRRARPRRSPSGAPRRRAARASPRSSSAGSRGW